MAMDGSDTLPLKTSFLLKKCLNEGLMLYLHKPLLLGGLFKLGSLKIKKHTVVHNHIKFIITQNT